MAVRQDHLGRLGPQVGTELLECPLFLSVGHAWVDNRQLAVSVVDHIGLFSEHIACECMHHGA